MKPDLHTPRAGRAAAGMQGAVTLLTVTAMVVLAAAAGAYSARSTWLDQLSARHLHEGQQARLAAEAALAWGAERLHQAYNSETGDDFWSQAQTADCPAGHDAPAWQCVQMPVPVSANVPERDRWQLQLTVLRHLTLSPHVVELQAQAVKAAAQARLRRSVYIPAWAPLPPVTEAARVSGSATALQTTPCPRKAWQQALGGVTPAQVKSWSLAQERNGLTASSQPARSVYWIDSAQDWSQSLGQPQAPVLLVFSETACTSRCPRLLPGVQVHGTVVLAAACQDARVQDWSTGSVSGQLVAEASAAAVQPLGQISATAYARLAFDLPWPDGLDASRVQWVAGSYSRLGR